MADYKGNFYSPDAYNPSYWANKLMGVVKDYTVTAADVTATKADIGLLDDFTGVVPICNIYRTSGVKNVALPTNFTISYAMVNGQNRVFVEGNANYTLTAGDIIVYVM